VFGFLKGNVLVMTVTGILGFFARGTVFPYISLYVLALGGTTGNIGFIDSLRPLASLLIFPIAGYFADRSGRVRPIFLAMFLSALINLVYIFANNWIMFAIGNFIGGLIVFHFPAQSALMADSLPPKQRGIGFATSNAIPSAIAVIAPFFAGFLIDEMGVETAMRYLYVLMLLCYAASAVIQMMFLQDTVERSSFRLGLSDFKTLMLNSYRDVMIALKRAPVGLRPLTLIIAFCFVANAMAGPFWVVYGTQVIGLSASEWGLLMLIYSSVRTVLSIPAGATVDRFGKRKTIIISFLITTPSVLYFTFSRGFIDVLIVFLFLSIASAFLVPASSSYMADIVPRKTRGRVMAAIGRGTIMINPSRAGLGGPNLGFIFTLPLMAGLIMGGYVYGINPSYPWILQFVFLLGSLIVSLTLLREPEKAEV
jgi:MFS family permease